MNLNQRSLIACTALAAILGIMNPVHANGDEAPIMAPPAAEPAPPPAPVEKSGIQHGLYAGVAAGLRIDQHDIQTQVDDGNGTTPGIPLKHDFDISDEAFSGGFQIGYGARFAKHFHVSLEGDILFGNSNEEKSVGIDERNGSVNSSVKVKGRNRYGLAARLGGYWNQALFYVRLGVEWQKFKTSVTPKDFPAPGEELTINKSYTEAAFAPGLGMEVSAFNDKASFGIDYRVGLYDRKTATNPSLQSDVASTQLRHKPRVHSILIRFNYKLLQFTS